MYKVMKKGLEDTWIIKLDTNTCIPFCQDNQDYQAYLEWCDDGNVAEIEEI